MPHLRIAAIQMDYQPVTRTTAGGWRLDEPLASNDPLAEPSQPDFLLSSLKGQHNLCRDVCDRAMKDSRQTYTTNLTEKVREIMTFCFKLGVDLVVFPEYAVPLAALDALRQFSTRMTIIAGIGYLQRTDIDTLHELGFDVEGVSRASNAAIVLSPEKNCIVTKQYPAAPENISPGTGASVFKLVLPKGTFSVGVAICLDFIRERSLLASEEPHIVAIPALSHNVGEFVTGVPREFVRIFANHAAFGGTYIGAPSIKGLNFTDMNGTIPLDKGIEGIVIVDWDYKHPFALKPSSTQTTDHRLYARASIIYSGRDFEIAQAVQRSDAVLSESVTRIDDLVHLASSTRLTLSKFDKRYHLLDDALDALEAGSEILAEDETRALGRHCVLSSSILSITEWRYLRCVSAAEQLKRLQDRIPEIVAAPFGEYESLARILAKDVRSNLVELRHRGTVAKPEHDPEEQEQLVFFGNLGRYGTQEAVKTLKRQLTLLRAIADLQDPHLLLRYRMETVRDSANITHARYEVICTTRGCTQEELEALREGIGQMIGVTFLGAYSIGWTISSTQIEEAISDIRQKSNWWVEIKPTRNVDGRLIHFKGMSDWSIIIDLVRRLTPLSTVELQCTALSPLDSSTIESESDKLSLQGEYAIAGSLSDVDSSQTTQLFWKTLSAETGDARRLSVRIFVGSQEPLPTSIVDAIAIELAGASSFEIVNQEVSQSYPSRDSSYGLSPLQALEVFHPPFGSLYPSSGRDRDDLDLASDATDFPPTGIVLGNARVRQVRADEQIEVRLSETDRLRHMYVVGKTGTGKTNLLKTMATQDVQTPGRGVTIIDPHGDLVDHVLRVIPEERINEVTLIDLARTDALPIMNPLDIDRKDITVRDRTIQELISLMRTRIFHQYTGPRFEELVRLVFQTMLDEGYPEPASFVEVSRILMEKDTQIALRKILKDEELKRRWEFQETMMRDNEYGGLIHYVISKFEEIARDSTLSAVMGGSKSTINIDDIVQQSGILLVRIPQAVIGTGAADFIGSLILLQLKMAIIRRGEIGQVHTPHFVYVDEFQNFANTDFHTLVAEARKFKIGFTLANQNLEQLREFRTHTGVHEQRLINAIFGNVANLVIFGIGAFDAKFLSDYMAVDTRNIMRIGRFEALAKILVNGFDTTAFTLRTREAPKLESPRTLEAIERRMKGAYWVDRILVLEDIAGRLDRAVKHAEELSKPVVDKGSVIADKGSSQNVNVPTESHKFPSDGIILGKVIKASEATNNNNEVDVVRMRERDRFQHVFIIGKRDTGKTNLLKTMAAQDAQIPGRGITIIDPDGDLADHILNTIPVERTGEVTFIDLGQTDALPILNLLDLSGKDIMVRDRVIQELIMLMNTWNFHQHTNTRVDEIVRLTFQSMLDEGYPVAASFIDISRLLTDRDAQSALMKLLKSDELKRRWAFQAVLERDPEYVGALHTIISRIDDIARDTKLLCILGGGKSTIDIDKIIQKGHILIVKLPKTLIGKQAVKIIGSLILLQMRMSILRLLEDGQLQHEHFVYLDEAECFNSTDLTTFMSETRKFNAGVTFAYQTLQELRGTESVRATQGNKLANNLINNVGSLIAFELEESDAELLSEKLRNEYTDEYRRPSYRRLHTKSQRYEAKAKILVDNHDFPSITLMTQETPQPKRSKALNTIVQRMKKTCWIQRVLLLEEIVARIDRMIKLVNESSTKLEILPLDGQQTSETSVRRRTKRNETLTNTDGDD